MHEQERWLFHVLNHLYFQKLHWNKSFKFKVNLDSHLYDFHIKKLDLNVYLSALYLWSIIILPHPKLIGSLTNASKYGFSVKNSSWCYENLQPAILIMNYINYIYSKYCLNYTSAPPNLYPQCLINYPYLITTCFLFIILLHLQTFKCLFFYNPNFFYTLIYPSITNLS